MCQRDEEGPGIELLGQQFGDLDGVEGGALAEVVAGDEEVEGAWVVHGAADAADPGGVGADGVDGHGELAGGGVVDEDDAGGVAEDLAGASASSSEAKTAWTAME